MVDLEIRRNQKREANARYRRSEKGRNKRKEYAKKYRKTYKAAHKDDEEYRRKRYEYSLRWKKKNKIKKLCHDVVYRAKLAGVLSEQPCCICSSTKNIHGHHRDYSKPLEVEWLCAECHSKIHIK